jgi:two-component system, NarL family, nitrate/nitrite response regulator NarL
MSIQILIVDDSPAIRHSLRSSIERNTDWTICAEAENGAMAIDKVKALNPDVVILDLSMPVMNGLLAAKCIASIAPRVLMIMFTLYTADPLVREAKRAGVRRVVSKSDGAALLLTSLTELLSQPQAP